MTPVHWYQRRVKACNFYAAIFVQRTDRPLQAAAYCPPRNLRRRNLGRILDEVSDPSSSTKARKSGRMSKFAKIDPAPSQPIFLWVVRKWISGCKGSQLGNPLSSRNLKARRTCREAKSLRVEFPNLLRNVPRNQAYIPRNFT